MKIAKMAKIKVSENEVLAKKLSKYWFGSLNWCHFGNMYQKIMKNNEFRRKNEDRHILLVPYLVILEGLQ